MDIANIAGIVRLHGRERPEQVAIVYGERELTWRELDETSNQIANALVAAGVQADDRVARIEKNAPDYFLLAFAASKINAVLVDVNWRLAAAEMRQIVDDAGAKLLFVGADVATSIDKIEGDLATVQQTIMLLKMITLKNPQLFRLKKTPLPKKPLQLKKQPQLKKRLQPKKPWWS